MDKSAEYWLTGSEWLEKIVSETGQGELKIGRKQFHMLHEINIRRQVGRGESGSDAVPYPALHI
ncbi:hypothetical protein [Paenibacillus taihuensis]|uniref:hypothetical protein n=1 Tax=Paenibacillus taihuensis TaxID=1156355 RepID=UPI000E22BA6B|nr:hypothetical protein [Paenibacillus taihuensis]